MTTTMAIAWSVALYGIDATPLTVSVQIGATPGPAVPAPEGRPVGGEVLERVRAAIRNSGLSWPTEQVIVTTSSPLPGGASLADLAVACAVLAADGQFPAVEVGRTVFLGELGLDGHLRPVRGALPALLAARRAGLDRAIVPTGTLPEAALLSGIQVVGADRLAGVTAGLRGARGHLTVPARHTPPTSSAAGATSGAVPVGGVDPMMPAAFDVPDLAGQPEAVRAVEVAAAGGHHLLLVGRPGAGCSRYARLLHYLRPPLTREQALEVTAVHSMAGLLMPEAPLVTTAPFIAPHYSTSVPALVGGGAGLAQPGAISHAHHGILYLEDAGAFGPSRLEALRTALEEGEVRLARRDGVARYPARFQLVLATTPCPCRHAEPDCGCSPLARRRFLARITGSLLDRIDLRVRLHPPDDREPGTSVPDGSAVVRARVQQARSRAAERWAAHGGSTNADVPPAVFTRAEFRLPRTVTAPLDRAVEIGAVTGRGRVRALRVAWTLADLAGLTRPGRDQITEALEFRDRRA